MSETKCDPCTGLACGDECDGKSHATTERTCETCGEHLRAIICPICRDFDQWKPRPSAQDANECRKAFEVWFIEYYPGSHPSSHGSIEYSCWESAWNRRPSLPMSAEVEKAIDTVRELIVCALADIKQVHPQSKTSIRHRDMAWIALDKAIDLIVAALKARG
jgi:hypothetical protein